MLYQNYRKYNCGSELAVALSVRLTHLMFSFTPFVVGIVVFSICGQICTLWRNVLPRSPGIEDLVKVGHCTVTNQLGHKFSDIKTEAIRNISAHTCKTYLMSHVTNHKTPQCRLAQRLLLNCIVLLKVLIYVLVKLLYSF